MKKIIIDDVAQITSDVIKLMDDFALDNGWQLDFSATRLHHEIYLSDPRKTAPEKLKTIIRHPVRKV